MRCFHPPFFFLSPSKCILIYSIKKKKKEKTCELSCFFFVASILLFRSALSPLFIHFAV